MTKPQHAPEVSDEPILFDRDKTNVIGFDITKNRRSYHVEHTLRPLTDERFFQMAKEGQEALKRATRVTTELMQPRLDLWHELVDSVSGYKEREDWQKGVHYLDKLTAINLLVHTQPIEEEPVFDDSLALDDQPVEVRLRVLQCKALIEVKFRFREESQKQMDRFLAIDENTPKTPGVIASHQQLTQPEKLYNLGKELLLDTEGYVGQPPAWHLAVATKVFFSGQADRVGKL